jgi:hypothetical protein
MGFGEQVADPTIAGPGVVEEASVVGGDDEECFSHPGLARKAADEPSQVARNLAILPVEPFSCGRSFEKRREFRVDLSDLLDAYR